MSLSTYEVAKLMEQLDESPEKVMYGKLLVELSSLSEERIKSAANQVPLINLKDLVYQFQQVIDSRKEESMELIKQKLLEDGFDSEDLIKFYKK